MIQLNANTFVKDMLQPDSGFQFGRAVFETLPVYRRPVFWQRHLERLNRGLAELEIREPVDPIWLADEVKKLPISDCVLKIMVSEQNLVLQTRPLPPVQPSCRLTIQPDWRSRYPQLLQNKSTHYLAGLLAWEAARSQGYDDALLVNPAGNLAEASRSNLFFYARGKIHTPDLICGLLPGIMRQWLLEQEKIVCGVYKPDVLEQADAVWVCNSLIGICPVTEIDGRAVQQHPLVGRLQQRYEKLVLDRAK